MSRSSRKIRLLIITTEYHHGLRYRLHHFLPYLMRWFDVTIVSIAPALYDVDTNDGSFLRGILAWASHTLRRPHITKATHSDGVVVLRSFPWSHLLFHRVDMAVLTAVLLRLSGFSRSFDVVYASPHMAGFAALLARLRPLVYDDVDRLAQFTSNPLKRVVFRTIEGFCIRNASIVVSAGYSLRRSAEKIRNGRAEMITNAVDVSLFKARTKVPSDQLVMIYIGGIEPWSGLDETIRALAILRKEHGADAKLLIVGLGSQKYVASLKRVSMEEGVEAFLTFHEAVPYEHLAGILSRCHVGLATFKPSGISRYAFPFKVLEYMAAGLPSVVSGIEDAAEMVRRFGCGLSVSHKARAIAEAVHRIASDEQRYRQMSVNAVEAAKNFDVRTQAEKLRTIIDTVAAQGQ